MPGYMVRYLQCKNDARYFDGGGGRVTLRGVDGAIGCESV